jgi:hypothetical protein
MEDMRMENREWFDYDENDLKDKTKQIEVFQRMLHLLEKRGDCSRVFHFLAHELFSNYLGDW